MNAHASSPLVNAARELLSQGDPAGAEHVLGSVYDQLKGDAATLHLMGSIKKAQNKLDEAERCFRSAIAHSLSEGAYYNDLGVVLQLRGDFAEATRVLRAALALLPKAGAIRVNLTQCLMAAGDLVEAEREARAYIAAEPGPESWTLLGQVQRAQEQNEAALTSAETALKFAPKMRGLRYNHAAALDRVGRGKEALEIYERLARQDLDTSELALNFMRALYLEGRKQDAETLGEEALARWPGNVTLHATVARMRFLRGEGQKSVALMEAEIARRPNDLSLRLTCADALHRAQLLPHAAQVLEAAIRLAPDTPALLTAFGVILDELDRPRDGLAILRRVVELTGGARGARRNLLSTLLRAGMPDEALSILQDLRATDADEQYLIACETTARRMQGDAGYREWCDYQRLVRTYEVPAPQGFFTAESFNATVSGILRAQHRTNAHPLDQYLHNGTLTGRGLLTLEEQNIKVFMAAIDVHVRDYIKGLEGAAPVVGRRGKHYRYGGLWSMRLNHEGYQPNHVHDRSWISSAYYAALMPAERPRDPKAGWLKFGEPNRPPAGCGPEKWIEPKVGMLVLFPSYFWHGVTPYEGAERLSASFDVLPG
jgi:tetratricopeptide (TPR) repeat protein